MSIVRPLRGPAAGLTVAWSNASPHAPPSDTDPHHDAQALTVGARWDGGEMIGGAIGHTWGPFCKLQHVWVVPAAQHRGLATQLMNKFHRDAAARGCRIFYLVTMSPDAPTFYEKFGYRTRLSIDGAAPGATRRLMVRALGGKNQRDRQSFFWAPR